MVIQKKINQTKESVALARKKIYTYLESVGLTVTDSIHVTLRAMFKEMCNLKTEDLQRRLTEVNNRLYALTKKGRS